jgi:addiction module RelE/StbE family toxin
MQVRFSPDFDRQFIRRLTARQQIKALDILELFQDEPFHKDLRNHSLKGEWYGHNSITISADLRMHFQMLDNKTAYFVAVGTHDQLYK